MRKVTYAKLQGTDAFIPGIGALGSTLPPLSKSQKMEMFDGGDKLLIKIAGKEVFIPMTNVQVAVYAPEDKPVAKAEKPAA